MRVSLYPDTNSVYVDLADPPSAESREVADGVVLDFDGSGLLVGIDINVQESEEMSIPNTRPMRRRPTHPGEMLREEFLPDYQLSATALAKAAGISPRLMRELLSERRPLSPDMALRFAKLFGTSADYWLNMQRAVDLWDARQASKSAIARIKPIRAS
jgi:addiction module HigA family antidote